MGSILGGRGFELVLVSPLRRAVESCEIAGYGGEALVEPDCMEWDYGELNGKTRAEVRAWLGEDWSIWKGPVPGGETPVLAESGGNATLSMQRDLGKWTGDAKFYRMADLSHAEFVIFWGANVMEGNYGPPLKVPKITRGMASNRLKVAVVDPRNTRMGSKAWKWLPIKPGEDAAMAMAMIRWIIENQRYGKRYPENCNKAAATADGEPAWSSGAWLVFHSRFSLSSSKYSLPFL